MRIAVDRRTVSPRKQGVVVGLAGIAAASIIHSTTALLLGAIVIVIGALITFTRGWLVLGRRAESVDRMKRVVALLSLPCNDDGRTLTIGTIMKVTLSGAEPLLVLRFHNCSSEIPETKVQTYLRGALAKSQRAIAMIF
jgi:hypothetical protein